MNCFEVGKIVRKKYMVLSQIGAGGYGKIFKVENQDTDELSALKVYKKLNRDDLTESLVGEKKILEELRSVKGIPVLEDSFIIGQWQCLVMPLYLGDLENLKRERYSPKTTLKIGIHIVDILRECHEAGFLHRDLKPSNMMVPVSQRTTKLVLLDWGLGCRFQVRKNGKRGAMIKIPTPINDVDFRRSSYAPRRLGDGFGATAADDLEGVAYTLMMCRNVFTFSGSGDDLMRQKDAFRNNVAAQIPNSSLFLVEVIEVLLNNKPGNIPKYDRILGVMSNCGYHINEYQSFNIRYDKDEMPYIQ